MEPNSNDITSPPTPQNIIEKYNVNLIEQNLILEIEYKEKSLIFTIIDTTNKIPVLYESELNFDYFKEKDERLIGLKDISNTYKYIKSLIEQKKYKINKENEEIFTLFFSIPIFNEEIKLSISIHKLKMNTQDQNRQISLAINDLAKNYNDLENRIKSLGLDETINNINPSFTMKNEENNLDIELYIIKDLVEICFIETKNYIKEKYSINLDLKDLCLKDEYFSIMKNCDELFNFIKATFDIMKKI